MKKKWYDIKISKRMAINLVNALESEFVKADGILCFSYKTKNGKVGRKIPCPTCHASQEKVIDLDWDEWSKSQKQYVNDLKETLKKLRLLQF
jgi:hypothetical protein